MKSIAELQKKQRPADKKKVTGKVHLHCLVCGFDWFAKGKNPKECPACKSRYWKTGRTPTGKKAVSKVDGDALE